jgi:hypothetical protein
VCGLITHTLMHGGPIMGAKNHTRQDKYANSDSLPISVPVSVRESVLV